MEIAQHLEALERPKRRRGVAAPSRIDTAGFTLLEVLVAFTVMATLLSVLYRGAVQMRAGSAVFDDHAQREIVARAVLEEALAARDTKPGTYHGIREGRPWTLVAKTVDLRSQLPRPAVDPRDPKAANGQPAPQGQPAGQEEKPKWATQRLLVRVGAEGRQLEIETLRMVRAE